MYLLRYTDENDSKFNKDCPREVRIVSIPQKRIDMTSHLHLAALYGLCKFISSNRKYPPISFEFVLSWILGSFVGFSYSCYFHFKYIYVICRRHMRIEPAGSAWLLFSRAWQARADSSTLCLYVRASSKCCHNYSVCYFRKFCLLRYVFLDCCLIYSIALFLLVVFFLFDFKLVVIILCCNQGMLTNMPARSKHSSYETNADWSLVNTGCST